MISSFVTLVAMVSLHPFFECYAVMAAVNKYMEEITEVTT
jgi:hypothetical protein